MADFITPAALINGSVDLDTMAKAANGTREETVNPRLGGSYHTLAYYLTELANVLADNTISANAKLAAFNTFINGLTLSADQKIAVFNSYVNGLNITAQQKLDILNGLVAAGNTEITNLQSAINIAAAAGAGANGWTALLVQDASGKNQQQINDMGASYWRSIAYPINARVMLDNGDIVQSTVAANVLNPNVDMTGWLNSKVNIVITSQFPSIVAAEQYAYTHNQSLLVDSSRALSGNLNMRVEVEVAKGAIIDTNSHDLTFEKNLTAGRYQIFTGTGAVTAFKCEEAFSDWFGAVADGYTYGIDGVDTVNGTYTVNGNNYAFGVAPSVSYTDATVALQRLINLGARKTVITDSGNGIYMIDTQNWLKFIGKFNRELVLEAQLKAIPTNALSGCVLLMQDIWKCKVTAKSKIVGNLLEHDLLNESEYIHSYHIANAVDCDFNNLETEFNVGDGSYVAYARSGDWLDISKYTRNIRFNGGSHSYNRRTGHVIEIGNHIYHTNVHYINNGKVRGTSTWSGVDVEPFGSDETKIRYADHIYFDECVATGNHNGGIRFERVYNGAIRNCVLNKNGTGAQLHRCGIVSEWSVSYKEVTVKDAGYIHVHGNHMEDNNFGFACSYGLSQFNLYDNTFVNCRDADMVIRAINSNIYDNITNRSQGTELMHLINSNYERNTSIDFYPARDFSTAKFAIGTSQNYNHPAYSLSGDVLVDTRITFAGTGYTYENIALSVTGSSTGDDAQVYPIITNGVLTKLQILHHGSGYNDGCTITVSGGTTNATVTTFCETLSSTSRICNNSFRLSSKIDPTADPSYSQFFGIIKNGNPIVKNNYFDPRLAVQSLITGARSVTKNRIEFADLAVSQLLEIGTLVQDNDGLKVVTVAGSLRPIGELWGASRTVKRGQTTQTTGGKSYICVQEGTTGATEIGAEHDYVVDGTAAWAFLFKYPTLKTVSFT